MKTKVLRKAILIDCREASEKCVFANSDLYYAWNQAQMLSSSQVGFLTNLQSEKADLRKNMEAKTFGALMMMPSLLYTTGLKHKRSRKNTRTSSQGLALGALPRL